MIALTSLQQKLYEAAKLWSEKHGDAPFAVELHASIGWDRFDFNGRVKALISKGYLAFDVDGKIVAHEPPHDRILREVCTANGIAVADVQSPSKTMKLTRARRTISKRLQHTGYSFNDISKVVYRHPSTVLDYLFPDRAAARSQRRAAEQRQKRAQA